MATAAEDSPAAEKSESRGSHSDEGTDLSLLDALRRNFVIVVDDKMFSKRVFSRQTKAEVIGQKLSKKTGSSVVISLSEASRDWASKLQPTVHSNQIYRLHPVHPDEEVYLAVGVFHNTVLDEKRQELQAILRELGAKRIEWSRRREWNLEYELPVNSEPAYDPSKHTYVHYESAWQTMIDDRLRGWCAQFTMVFSYENDYQVNDEIINKINKKLGNRRISSKTNVLEQMAPSQVRAANFKPIRDTVHVTFFSRDEHKRYTQQLLQSQWTEDHVEAWLRQTNMFNWFTNAQGGFTMTARELFSLDIASLVEMYKLNKEQCDSFMSKRNQIGEPGNLDSLVALDRQADEIRHQRLYPKKKLKKPSSNASLKSASVASHATAQTAKQNSALNAHVEANHSPDRNSNGRFPSISSVTTGTYVEEKEDDVTTQALDAEGVFELVILGDSGVGKSSIVNRWLGKSFNPSEVATPGVVYLEHSLGKATLNIWDTAGQKSQRSQAALHTRRADVCVFVYDITNPKSLETARVLLADVSRTGVAPHCSLCLVGNKSDKEKERKVSMVDGLRLAQEFGVSLFFETSAVRNDNLTILLCNAILAAANREPRDMRNSVVLTEDNASPNAAAAKKRCGGCCS